MLRIRVNFDGAFQGTPYLATHYWSGLNLADATAAVAAVGALWTDLSSVITDQLTWNTETDVYAIDEVTGIPVGAFTVPEITGQGDAISEPLPIASQALIRWTTGEFINGRQVRGRTFVPGMTEGSSNDGALADTQFNALNAIAEQYADFVGPVIWSRANGTSVPIQGGSVWRQFAMMTSRRD